MPEGLGLNPADSHVSSFMQTLGGGNGKSIKWALATTRETWIESPIPSFEQPKPGYSEHLMEAQGRSELADGSTHTLYLPFEYFL